MDVLASARGGDTEAFGELTEPYRRELQLHCYRMLGSLQDAEDALQETMLSAWRGLPGFDGRASVRTWMYRIATNTCLSALRSAGRRPAKAWDIPGMVPPEPSRLGELPWLEPYPDELLSPEVRYEQAESVSLAFVTALQTLPPRQVAVLVLRDVLAFRAQEVADMLDTTVESVKSLLKRARAALPAAPDPAAAAPTAPGAEEAIAARFVSAYQAADVDAIVALLTDDVFMSMPPLPLEYVGLVAVRDFYAMLFAAGLELRLVPTRANGQPAFGNYVRTAEGGWHASGLIVLGLTGDRISAVNRFENGVMRYFGLPRTLPVPLGTDDADPART